MQIGTSNSAIYIFHFWKKRTNPFSRFGVGGNRRGKKKAFENSGQKAMSHNKKFRTLLKETHFSGIPQKSKRSNVWETIIFPQLFSLFRKYHLLIVKLCPSLTDTFFPWHFISPPTSQFSALLIFSVRQLA